MFMDLKIEHIELKPGDTVLFLGQGDPEDNGLKTLDVDGHFKMTDTTRTTDVISKKAMDRIELFINTYTYPIP